MHAPPPESETIPKNTPGSSNHAPTVELPALQKNQTTVPPGTMIAPGTPDAETASAPGKDGAPGYQLSDPKDREESGPPRPQGEDSDWADPNPYDDIPITTIGTPFNKDTVEQAIIDNFINQAKYGNPEYWEVTNISKAQSMSASNKDKTLGESQQRYYINVTDTMTGEEYTFSVNYDPELGRFGQIHESSGPKAKKNR